MRWILVKAAIAATLKLLKAMKNGFVIMITAVELPVP
jgi:hypothetical protein